MDDPVDLKDELFEPTVDMMVNDFDDEATLEEEENLADPGQDQNELDNLQREGELPLEELMRLYNCPPPMSSGHMDHMKPRKPRKKRKHISTTTTTTLVNNNPEEEQIDDAKAARLSDEVVMQSEAADDNQVTSTVAEAEGPVLDTPAETNSLPDEAREDEECDEGEEDDLDGPSELVQLLDDVQDDEEEADYDYYPDESDLKKAILVGENHQAVIPETVLPPSNEHPPGVDQLLWSPHSEKVNDGAVERFLASFYKLRRHLNHPEEQPGVSAEELINGGGVSITSTTDPSNKRVVKDEECALEKLLEADYNVQVALQQVCNLMQANGGGLSGGGGGGGVTPAPVTSGYCGTAPSITWTEEECRHFELGIRLYGKNFTLIQATKVPSRSVQDLVQFYYFWKKTDRYDSFAAKQRLEKKRHSLSNQNPGLTEFMDKFLEEQRSISPRQHSVTSSHSPSLNQMSHGAGVAAGRASDAAGGGECGGAGKPSLLLGNNQEGGGSAAAAAAAEAGILDGNHSLLIYADSKRHRTSGGPVTPPVATAASEARHPLEELAAIKAAERECAGAAAEAAEEASS